MVQSNEPGGVIWACLTCGRSGGPAPSRPHDRIYPCVCHVCGHEYDLRAAFMSAGITQYGADGRERAIRSCGKHPAADVRAAYLRITGGGPDGLAAAIAASRTEAAG